MQKQATQVHSTHRHVWILVSVVRTVEATEGFHLRYEGRRLNFTFGEDHSG